MRRRQFLLDTVLSVLLCSSLILSVRADASSWVQNYGGAVWEEVLSLIETSDGGYALAGYTYSFGAGYADFWLVKTDMNGNMEWNRTYGGPGDDIAKSLAETSDGGYAIAGFTSLVVDGERSDGWLVKTDAFGNMEWNQTYGGAGSDAFNSLVETSDGGFAIAGMWNCSIDYFWSDSPVFVHGVGDGWLVKTNATGHMEWNMTYVEASSGAGCAFSLVATSDGGYAFAGSTGSEKFWLVKTDEFGTMEWDKTYGSWSVAYSLVATSDGGYALAGSNGVGDGWLVKTDADGNMEWNQTYGGAEDDRACSLVATSDGGYAIAGIWDFYCSFFIGPGFGAHGAFWLVKTDADGIMEWNYTYGGGFVDWAYSLVATSDGGYALAGVTTSFGTGDSDVLLVRGDFWLVKTDEDGVAPVEPEAAWVVLPFLLAATLAIFISKKKLLHPRS